MDCLKNYIGLKNCGTEDPESGYLVNELPGISTELAHRVADGEQLNFAGVWENVKTRSQRKFGQLVQRFINRNQNWNEILYQTSGFKVVMPLAYQSVETATAVINLPEGKYIEANVRTILVYSETATTTAALTITGAFDNELKKVEAIELKTGLNRVPVNVAIGSDEAGQQFTVSLSIPDSQLSLAPINLNDTAGYACDSCEGVTQTNGLIIPEIDIKCSVSRYICENVNLFSYALWYLHGAELLAEKLTSPRTTYFSTSNLEYTKRLQQDFYHEFEESTVQALKSINWQGLCVACKEDNPGQISYGTMVA